MSTSRCTTCEKAKSAKAVVCPHCGAADTSLDPRDHEAAARKAQRAAGEKERAPLSGLEAGQLMEGAAPRRVFWADFFLPSPLRGAWLWVDLALIVLTLPLALGVFVSLVRAAGEPHRTVTVSGLFFENALIALLGGVIVLWLAGRAEQLTVVAPIIGVATLALAARAWLRAAGPR